MHVPRINRNGLILALAWILAAVAVLPILFHWHAGPPRISRTRLAWQICYPVAFLICGAIYWAESRQASRKQGLIVAFSCLFLTGIVNNVHRYYIDQGPAVFAYASNENWQETLQQNVVILNPGVAPHSYRFLPNGIVQWLQIARVDYRSAADTYRLLTGLLLFYAIYRFARRYTTFAGALIAILLPAALYPISIERYAGQLTDPLSHLSFVIAFISLATANFPLLFTTLLIGSLAKETVSALAGFYVLFCRSDRRYVPKAVVLCVASLAFYYGVRYFVLHGTMSYTSISLTDRGHILAALQDPRWPFVVPLMVFGGAYFLLIAWKNTPPLLKNLYLFLVPVLLITSFVFSWPQEGRNYMPLVYILGVIAGRACAGSDREDALPCHVAEADPAMHTSVQ